jgi:hypothetical protein
MTRRYHTFDPLSGSVEDLPDDGRPYAIATYAHIFDFRWDNEWGKWSPKPFQNNACVPIDANGEFGVSFISNECGKRTQKLALYLIPADHPHCTSAWLKWDLESGDSQWATPLASLEVARPCDPVTAFGYDWLVKQGGNECGGGLDPGPCYYSRDNVEVIPRGSPEENERLLLTTYYEARNPAHCEAAEVILSEELGYGSYVFTVENPVNPWGSKPILGFYTWDADVPPDQGCVNANREMDFEFNEDLRILGCQDVYPECESAECNAQFAIQPVEWTGCPGKCDTNLHRFRIDYSDPTKPTTHAMKWTPEAAHFTSYYGGFTFDPPAEEVIASWEYSGADNPMPGKANFRMIFYLAGGGPGPPFGDAATADISYFAHFPMTECSDDLDNDGDGFADYPEDPGCGSGSSPTENPECDDEIDNDEDGTVDWDGHQGAFSPDPECAGLGHHDSEAVPEPNFLLGLGAGIAFLAVAGRQRRTAQGRLPLDTKAG